MGDYEELLSRADRQASAHVTLNDVAGPLAAALRTLTRERDLQKTLNEMRQKLLDEMEAKLIARAEQAEARLTVRWLSN